MSPEREVTTSRSRKANPLREAYFGDTHVHTAWSCDTFIAGVRTGPEDAYRFARGEAIDHFNGEKIQLKTGPLDFMALTEHSEYLGVFPLMLDPSNPLFNHRLAVAIRGSDPTAQQKALLEVAGSFLGGGPIPELLDEKTQVDIWKQIQEVAERFNNPGTFTTFIGYEWSLTDDGRNLHRNLIFRGSRVPERPFSTFDSTIVDDLWSYMEAARKDGIEVLAIPHNANLSDGLMFQVIDSHGKAIDRAYAERRRDNEPLVEIIQLKGQSEAHPTLSPTDEFAGFALCDFNFRGGTFTPGALPKGSFVRDALKTGLVLEEQTGVNPYKFGVVGASDTHQTGAAYEEDNYFGKIGREDGTAEVRLGGKSPMTPVIRTWGSAGLGGVWAEENTREAIFDAMARKETFGTSGPRIKVRFFGGSSFTKEILAQPDWLKTAYEKGVPMGGDLPAPPPGKAPTFIVWAAKDPNSGNLDRIQIVKGWTKWGQSFEKIYDVVWSGDRKPNPKTGKLPLVGNTVDVNTATYTNTIGATTLSGSWTDPEFDPLQRAFYYARVLEIPTPRWSTYDAVRLGIPLPPGLQPSIQERAYTSSVWYTPTEQNLTKGRQGAVTVAGLQAQGIAPLTDAKLRALIVGTTKRIRNLLTGEEATAFYSQDGKRTLATEAAFGAIHGGAATNPYEIRDGQLHSSFDDGSRFSSQVFNVGNRYLAAKSDEGGYVNYEIF
jgi:hypothetical protein